jgi:hypothetical protein
MSARAHAGGAQVDPKLEERFVAALGWCGVPLVNSCRPTLRPIALKLPQLRAIGRVVAGRVPDLHRQPNRAI